MSKQKAKARPIRSTLVTVIMILVIAGAILAAQVAGHINQPASGQRMTLEPEIIANLTRLPQATPLSGESASRVNELRTLVDACPDYSESRRNQMEQHIEWLLHPAQIPADIIIALGANPTGKLIYGMATYTSIQWRVNNRPADSCLLPIGNALNQMLMTAGEEPFPIFDDTP
jgi:hypothetical protein